MGHRHIAIDIRLPLDVEPVAALCKGIGPCPCGARLIVRSMHDPELWHDRAPWEAAQAAGHAAEAAWERLRAELAKPRSGDG
jgi:hypothetical protein